MNEELKSKFSEIYTGTKFYGINKEKIIEILSKKYPNIEDFNRGFLDNFENVIENRPQIIIDFIRNKITENYDLVGLIRDFKKENVLKENLNDKIEYLSKYWEISTLFSFHASIANGVSGGPIDPKLFTNPNKVYKCFKKLGYSNRDKETHRKLRNCSYHKFMISNGSIIDHEGNEVCEVNEVAVLYRKVYEIVSWVRDISKYTSIYCMKLLGIIFYTTINEYISNKSEFEATLKELKVNFPDFFILYESYFSIPEQSKSGELSKNQFSFFSSFLHEVKNRLIEFLAVQIFRLLPSSYKSEIAYRFSIQKNLLDVVLNDPYNVIRELNIIITNLEKKEDIVLFRLIRRTVSIRIKKMNEEMKTQYSMEIESLLN